MPGLPADEAPIALDRVDDSRAFAELRSAVTRPRLAVESLISEDARSARVLLPGYCRVCHAAVHFRVLVPKNGRSVNFREELVCPQCGLTNRQRFVAAYVLELAESFRSEPTVYAYEQRSALYDHLSKSLGARLTGSEYLGPSIAPGATVEGIRHEDATALSFSDNTFNLLVSNDVFEHVPDIHKALAEAVRVLRPGGILLCTVPFHGGETSEQVAVESDSGIEYLMPPEYHGDPMRPGEGALVYYHFGWDLLRYCIDAGFGDAYMLAYYSCTYGHLGDGVQIALRADM